MRQRSLLRLTFALFSAAASDAACSPYPLCDPSSAAMQVSPPDSFDAIFQTSAGAFTISVNSSWAPHAAARFHNLVRLGFYNKAYFFRVIAGFVNEFGLSGDPALQANYCNDETCPILPNGAPIKSDSILPGGPSNTRGTVAFSLMKGGVNGSVEVFINFGDNSNLDPLGFTPFGVVSEADMGGTVDLLYSGYGELNQTDSCPDPSAKLCHGPKLDRILDEGNKYLANEFPMMSFVHRASIAMHRTQQHTSRIESV